MNVYEKLLTVQTELNAPKNRVNKFGGYNYRSCEDIMEALKPLLKKVKATVTVLDDIKEINGRFYICSAATFIDAEKPDAMIVNTAYAREEETKKGMDGAQITGTASSYARKYALNGLFLIDDNKDPDTDEYVERTREDDSKKKTSSAKKEAKASAVLDNYITDGQIAAIEMLLNKLGYSVEKFCSVNEITVISELPADKYEDNIKKLEVAVKAMKEGE